MDAQVVKPLIVRLVTVWLVLLLAFGLWLGYGAWLVGSSDAG